MGPGLPGKTMHLLPWALDLKLQTQTGFVPSLKQESGTTAPEILELVIILFGWYDQTVKA